MMIRVLVSALLLGALTVPASTELSIEPVARNVAQPPMLSRTVTLNVPDARPVALLDALRAIARQTGTVISLDAEVPGDVQFSGRFTRAPLGVVLDAFAKTGAFKWFADTNGVVRLVPHDDLRIVWNAQQISGEPCRQCKRPLSATWRYCPWCGLAAAGPRIGPARPIDK